MQQFSYFLHLIWLCGFLYFFWSSKSNSSQNISQEQSVESASTAESTLPYVYINEDSLAAQFKMVSDLSVSIQKQKKMYENRYQAKVKKFQEDLVKFQEEAKYLTQAQGLARQNEFVEREKNIALLEGTYTEKLLKIEADNQKKLYDAVHRVLDELHNEKKYDLVFGYSKNSNLLFAADSFDITSQAIERLNQYYTAKDSLSNQ